MIALIAITMWIALGTLFTGMIKYQFITEFNKSDFKVHWWQLACIATGPMAVVITIIFLTGVNSLGDKIHWGWSNPFSTYKVEM